MLVCSALLLNEVLFAAQYAGVDEIQFHTFDKRGEMTAAFALCSSQAWCFLQSQALRVSSKPRSVYLLAIQAEFSVSQDLLPMFTSVDKAVTSSLSNSCSIASCFQQMDFDTLVGKLVELGCQWGMSNGT